MHNALLTKSTFRTAALLGALLSHGACSSSDAGTPSGLRDGAQNGSSGANGGAGSNGGAAGAASQSGAAGTAGGDDFGNPDSMTPTFPIADAGGNTIGSDPDTCAVGEAGSFATNEDLDLFGDVVYFNGGKPLPEGRYRIRYIDGCMLYMVGQAWAVHGSEAGNYAFWLVGESSADQIMMPPGTYGYQVGSGGYASFEQCIDANLALQPVEFEHTGGRLGIWLQDNPYADNLAGEAGRNPKWALTLLGSCTLLE